MKDFDYKLYEIRCAVEELGTVAWAAAAGSFIPEKCEQILDDVLYAIKNMSEHICGKIDTLSDELSEMQGVGA